MVIVGICERIFSDPEFKACPYNFGPRGESRPDDSLSCLLYISFFFGDSNECRELEIIFISSLGFIFILIYGIIYNSLLKVDLASGLKSGVKGLELSYKLLNT